MANSENGWQVIPAYGDALLHTWRIPTKGGETRINMRRGSVGFVLAHAVLYWDDHIEPVHGKVLDDWGYAPRPVRGSTVPSNHASGTAVDVNATRHPLGVKWTMHGMFNTLRRWLSSSVYVVNGRSILRWGGTYSGRRDEMHIEIRPGVTMRECEIVAKRLMNRPGGRRILALNPSQRKVILS